jgi:hypothetical protein
MVWMVREGQVLGGVLTQPPVPPPEQQGPAWHCPSCFTSRKPQNERRERDSPRKRSLWGVRPAHERTEGDASFKSSRKMMSRRFFSPFRLTSFFDRSAG